SKREVPRPKAGASRPVQPGRMGMSRSSIKQSRPRSHRTLGGVGLADDGDLEYIRGPSPPRGEDGFKEESRAGTTARAGLHHPLGPGLPGRFAAAVAPTAGELRLPRL